MPSYRKKVEELRVLDVEKFMIGKTTNNSFEFGINFTDNPFQVYFIILIWFDFIIIECVFFSVVCISLKSFSLDHSFENYGKTMALKLQRIELCKAILK